MNSPLLNIPRILKYKDAQVILEGADDNTAVEIASILYGEVFPLKNEQITRAVLKFVSEVRNLQVMYKSETMEDDDWVGLELQDILDFEESGENFFSDDIEAQLWIGEM